MASTLGNRPFPCGQVDSSINTTVKKAVKRKQVDVSVSMLYDVARFYS